MRTSTGIALTLATAVGLGGITLLAKLAVAEDSTAQTTYRDHSGIEKLGLAPCPSIRRVRPCHP